MASTKHNFRIKNGLEVGNELIVNSGTISNPSIWINDGTLIDGWSENIRLYDTQGVSTIALGAIAGSTSGASRHSFVSYSNNLAFFYGSSAQERKYNGYSLHTGSYRAPTFYDSNNTNYYLNPAETSVINSLIATTINRNPVVTLSGDVTGAATMTNLGSINITATVANNSHSHSNYMPIRTSTPYTIMGTTSWGSYNLGNGTMLQASSQGLPSGGTHGYWHVIGKRDTASGYAGLYVKSYNGGQGMWIGTNSTGTSTPNWEQVWTANTDGSGSGLDADLLDGQHGSYYYSAANPPPTYSKYLRSDTSDTMSGTLSLEGNLLLTGTATTANQSRMIDFTGFDKEGTTDPSDRAYIAHTINTGGHAGSVLVISSQNDSADGIAFATHSSSQLKHNSNIIWTAGNDGSGSGLDADLLDGQHGSYYAPVSSIPSVGNGTLTVATAGSASGGGTFTANQSGNTTITVTGATIPTSLPANGGNADTVDNLHAASFLRSDANDTFTGNITTGANNHITFGPNGTWGSSLRVGGNGRTATGTEMASMVTTDGNLHLDAAASANGVYLNFYAGTNGTFFGNGAGATTARMQSNGQLYKSSGTTNPYWNSTNDGSGSGLDADLLDGQHGSYYAPASHVHSYLPLSGGTLTGPLTVKLNAETTRAPTALTLHSTMGDINGAGDTDGTFIEFKATDGNATFTPQVKIGMLVKDYTNDSGILSEGTGNFVVYTSQGTDSLGGGTLRERFRVREDGILYAGTDRVFADNYHPNADKWTTARSHTVTLTGGVTGTASQNVDGTGNRTWTIATTVASISAPSAPSITATSVVGETIEITFSQSSTSNVDLYEVWSDGATGSDYSLIARVPEDDVAASMSIIDSSFDSGGTVAYRVYAIKEGVYSTAATATRAFTVPTNLDVTSLSVIANTNVYHINYNKPDSRFVDHIEIYKDVEVIQASLSRTGASLIYSGDNSSFTYSIAASDLDNYHQFWVEVVTV